MATTVDHLLPSRQPLIKHEESPAVFNGFLGQTGDALLSLNGAIGANRGMY